MRRRIEMKRMAMRAERGELDALGPTLQPLVPTTALKETYRQGLARLAECGSEIGDYLEFGVHLGSSLSCMYEVLQEAGLGNVRLYGFDSFDGLPMDADSDDTAAYGLWEPGSMGIPIELTTANLTQKGVDLDRVTLVKGWFDDTLVQGAAERLGIRKASVIMVDSDLYSSAKTALAFCEPLIKDHAVLVFDEWCPDTLGADNAGEARAFDEFLAEHPGFSTTELEGYKPGESKVFLVSRTSETGVQA
jgi:predicted O-methyltransferase YrrM